MGDHAMRHLVLPTLTGSCSTDANMVAKIEPISDVYCRVHMRPPPLDITKPGWVKPDEHNHIDVKLPAAELRSAIAEMDDGDVYDPWNLEMVGALDEA